MEKNKISRGHSELFEIKIRSLGKETQSFDDPSPPLKQPIFGTPVEKKRFALNSLENKHLKTQTKKEHPASQKIIPASQ